DAALVKAEGLATVLAVPVVDVDELIGALNVYSKDPARSFDEEDIEVAHVLAALAAATVLNTRAHALVVEQRELMRALFDELGDGVLVAQPGGTLSGMNRTARELTGLDDADIGRPLADLAATLQLPGAAHPAHAAEGARAARPFAPPARSRQGRPDRRGVVRAEPRGDRAPGRSHEQPRERPPVGVPRRARNAAYGDPALRPLGGG